MKLDEMKESINCAIRHCKTRRWRIGILTHKTDVTDVAQQTGWRYITNELLIRACLARSDSGSYIRSQFLLVVAIASETRGQRQ